MLLLALSLAREEKDSPQTEMVDYNLVYLVSMVFQLCTPPKQFVVAMCGQQQISSLVGNI